MPNAPEPPLAFDPAPDRSPRSRGERLVLAAGALFVLGAFAAEIATDYHPVKLSILFMVLAWAPLLALHEAGHAIVARALDWRVDRVVIGYGARLGELRVRGVPVEVRSIPVEGFVRCVPRTLRSVRARSAAIYLAGPGIELALAAALLATLGADVLLARSDRIAVIALQSLAAAAVLGGVINLLPHSTLSRSGEMPSDGLGVLQSLVAPIEAFEALVERDGESKTGDRA